jgi:hypothetical protein
MYPHELINRLRDKTPLSRLNYSECEAVIEMIDKLGVDLVPKGQEARMVLKGPPPSVDEAWAVIRADEEVKKPAPPKVIGRNG